MICICFVNRKICCRVSLGFPTYFYKVTKLCNKKLHFLLPLFSSPILYKFVSKSILWTLKVSNIARAISEHPEHSFSNTFPLWPKKKEMKEVFQKCLIWIFKPKIEMEKLIFATKIQPILNINRWLKMFKRKKKVSKLCVVYHWAVI